MFKRIKQAIKRGLPGKVKSLVKFSNVGSVGFPTDEQEDDGEEGEEEEEEEELPSGVNIYSNSAPATVGSKRLRDDEDDAAGDKENRPRQQLQRSEPARVQPRLVMENEAKVSESRKKLADQLAEKKTQVTDKRWETDRATARLVDLEDEDDAEWGNVFINNAFFGHEDGGAAPASKKNAEQTAH